MSAATPKDPLDELLVTLYANIVQYAEEERLPTAEKSYYSTRDYVLGDTKSCSADGALENCEQIRSCYANDVPKAVFDNIEQVKTAIKRRDNRERPHYFRWIVIFILVAAAITAAFEVYERFLR